ncbi:MAG: hypothetical protein NT108_01365 [Candidatus Kaiserbacteria bacterium]|nr:hypothetical protein [Candidatus Kaiserbacteria bacterium]
MKKNVKGEENVSESALKELAERVTLADIGVAIVACGCPSEGNFFSLASRQGNPDVSRPFVLLDELRDFGLLRKGDPPQDYKIPECVRLLAARIIASKDPKAEIKPISLKLKTEERRPPLNRKANQLQQ